jgi:hypothetical protein
VPSPSFVVDEAVVPWPIAKAGWKLPVENRTRRSQPDFPSHLMSNSILGVVPRLPQVDVSTHFPSSRVTYRFVSHVFTGPFAEHCAVTVNPLGSEAMDV